MKQVYQNLVSQYDKFHFQNLKTLIQKFKSSIMKRLVKPNDLDNSKPKERDFAQKAMKSQIVTENLFQEKWETELMNAQDQYNISGEDVMG